VREGLVVVVALMKERERERGFTERHSTRERLMSSIFSFLAAMSEERERE